MMYPMYPVNTPNPPYNPYAPYTSYGSYGAYGPWKSTEQAAANAEPAPDAAAARAFWSGRFGVVLGIVTAVVTVAAIVLAVAGVPMQAAPVATTPPGGYTLVYNASPLDNGTWTGGNGCAFTSQGLDVTGTGGGSVCVFQPSTNTDLTSQGFWLQATLAPSAYVENAEVPVILIGDSEAVAFDASGTYVIECQNDNIPCAAGTTSAWHANAFVANTITLNYDATSELLTIYANGQLVTSTPLTQDALFTQSAPPTLALGADSNSEALFTYVSIYSASADQSAGG